MKKRSIILFLTVFSSSFCLADVCSDAYCGFVMRAEQILAGNITSDQLSYLKTEVGIYQQDFAAEAQKGIIKPPSKRDHYSKALTELDRLVKLRSDVSACGDRASAVMEGVIETCPASKYLDEKMPISENHNFIRFARDLEGKTLDQIAGDYAKQTGKSVLSNTFDQLASYLKSTGQFEELRNLFSAANLKKYHLESKASLQSNYFPKNFRDEDSLQVAALNNRQKNFEQLMSIIKNANAKLSQLTADIRMGRPGFAVVTAALSGEYLLIKQNVMKQVQALGPLGMGGKIYSTLNNFPKLDLYLMHWDYQYNNSKSTWGPGKFKGRISEDLKLSDIEDAEKDVKNLLKNELDNSSKLAENGSIEEALMYNPSLMGKLVASDGLGANQSKLLCEMVKRFQNKKDSDEQTKIIKMILGGACGVASGILCFTPAAPVGIGLGIGCGALMTTDVAISLYQQGELINNLKSTLAADAGWTGTTADLEKAKSEFDQLVFELVVSAGFTALEVGQLLKGAKTLVEANARLHYAAENAGFLKNIIKTGDEATEGVMSCIL